MYTCYILAMLLHPEKICVPTRSDRLVGPLSQIIPTSKRTMQFELPMGRFSHYHNIQNSQSYGGFIPKIKVPWIIHFNGIFMDFPWNPPSSYCGTPSYGNPSRIEMSYATVIKDIPIPKALLQYYIKPFEQWLKYPSVGWWFRSGIKNKNQETVFFFNPRRGNHVLYQPVSRDAEGYKPSNYCWLVVYLQLGWWHSQNDGKVINLCSKAPSNYWCLSTTWKLRVPGIFPWCPWNQPSSGETWWNSVASEPSKLIGSYLSKFSHESVNQLQLEGFSPAHHDLSINLGSIYHIIYQLIHRFLVNWKECHQQHRFENLFEIEVYQRMALLIGKIMAN